ncbi:MAG: hypothetical protein J6A29_05410 [Clostridia bacterium]|nr:hypothetical protein [Clostridia bacterium]
MRGGKAGAQFASGLFSDEATEATRRKAQEIFPGRDVSTLEPSEVIQVAKETAQEMEVPEPRYKFQNVLMVSSCWGVKPTVMLMVEKAKEYGTNFYATYSSCDVEGTRQFTDVYMIDYLSAEPWHLDAIGWHGQTVWDIGTYDGDGDGKADIWETMFENDD